MFFNRNIGVSLTYEFHIISLFCFVLLCLETKRCSVIPIRISWYPCIYRVENFIWKANIDNSSRYPRLLSHLTFLTISIFYYNDKFACSLDDLLYYYNIISSDFVLKQAHKFYKVENIICSLNVGLFWWVTTTKLNKIWLSVKDAAVTSKHSTTLQCRLPHLPNSTHRVLVQTNTNFYLFNHPGLVIMPWY